VSGKSGRLLSWSHYTVLLQIKDRQARERRKASVIFMPQEGDAGDTGRHH
jgi:hypothetical protein